MAEERRRAPQVALSVAFSETDPRTTTPATSISEVGAYVLIEQRPPVGTVIEVCFAVLPEAPELFRAVGRVVRHGDDGVAVDFVELDDNQVALIGKLRERERSLGHRTNRSRLRTWNR